MLLKDNDKSSGFQTHTFGTTGGINNYASQSTESQANADQNNAWFNQYFGPLEQQYGLSQDELVKYFQDAPQNGKDAAGQAQQLSEGEQAYAAAMRYPDQWYDKLASTLALAGTVGVATAGIGSILGASVAPAVTAAAAGAGAGAGTAGAIGAVTAGALTGAAGGTLGSLATTGGKNIGSAVGKGALMGGVGGGLSYAGSASGLGGATYNVASGAGKGALGAAINGGDIAQGALSGGATAGAGAVTGSVFSNGSTVNQNLTNNNNMASDQYGSDDGLDYLQAGGQYINGPGMDYGFDPSQLGNLDLSGANATNMSSINQGYLSPDVLNALAANYASGGNGGTSTGLGALLSKLVGGLAGGGSGGNGAAGGSGGGSGSALGGLLGLLAQGGSSYLSSDAAKNAANGYATATKFNPFNIQTGQGTTSFNGQNVTSSFSPQTQATVNSLNGLASNASAGLNAGTGQAFNDQYSLLSKASQPMMDRYYQNTKDNEFANGNYSDTAGQYQSAAALEGLNNLDTQNKIQANNFANTQQQNQLAQLTGSLNGLNAINTNQQNSIGLGLSGGSDQGKINLGAYAPTVSANSNNPLAALLGGAGSGLATGANTGALGNYIQQLLTGNG